MESLRIAMIGAGAIGGITAAHMKQAGYDVHLVCKHDEIARLTRERGLHITGVHGEKQVQIPAVATIEELQGTFDLCLIATKAYDMPEAAAQMQGKLRADAWVVSMQNGICTDALAKVVGKERTVGCVIGWGATMHAPGELEMTSEGEFIIGRIDGGDAQALRPLQQAMQSVVTTEISDTILSELYSKLIVNSCITSLGAICGLRLGEMMKIKQARKIFLAIIGEAVQVARAMHLQVPPFGGKLDYEKLMAGSGFFSDLRRHTMIRIVGMKFKDLKSSSLQSLERNRPTEIDYFNGYICQKGWEHGVETPINARLTEMVKQIERGERKIEEKNLFDSAFIQL